tara:strand:- start:588 stop:890 length:303 start_codon:yes stop_codon:yes gene_type:complete
MPRNKTVVTVTDSDGNEIFREEHDQPPILIHVYKCKTCSHVISGAIVHYMAGPRIHYQNADGTEIEGHHSDMLGQVIKICGEWEWLGRYEEGTENPYLDK